MMKKNHSDPHGPREEAYQLSYDLARKQLAGISDLEEQCRKSGAYYAGPDRIVLNYLNQPYHITIPDVDLSLAESKAEVPLTDKILILHYFNHAEGTPPTGKLITFKQIPGGISYYPAFFQRVVSPLAGRFGKQPDLLPKAAARFGGSKADLGDVSVTINGLPLVPITLALWQGDDEVPPSANVLFDANITDYLPTEDVVVLCGNLVWRIIKEIPST